MALVKNICTDIGEFISILNAKSGVDCIKICQLHGYKANPVRSPKAWSLPVMYNSPTHYRDSAWHKKFNNISIFKIHAITKCKVFIYSNLTLAIELD